MGSLTPPVPAHVHAPDAAQMTDREFLAAMAAQCRFFGAHENAARLDTIAARVPV